MPTRLWEQIKAPAQSRKLQVNRRSVYRSYGVSQLITCESCLSRDDPFPRHPLTPPLSLSLSDTRNCASLPLSRTHTATGYSVLASSHIDLLIA
ncbi:hypothetical protein J6590_019753 [Homalodisca vitripennis]|nr:hypothetical protein J6590_019753 [Homalodisca vitripennis]